MKKLLTFLNFATTFAMSHLIVNDPIQTGQSDKITNVHVIISDPRDHSGSISFKTDGISEKRSLNPDFTWAVANGLLSKRSLKLINNSKMNSIIKNVVRFAKIAITNIIINYSIDGSTLVISIRYNKRKNLNDLHRSKMVSAIKGYYDLQKLHSSVTFMFKS